MSDAKTYGFATRAIHAGQEPDSATGAVIVPIYQTSTFAQEDVGVQKGYEYARSGNPTRAALETALAALDGGKYGLAFASGLAAETTVMLLLSAGDHVICGDDVYGGTFRLFDKIFRRQGLRFDFVDTSDPGKVAAAIRPDTRLVWLETPTNPLLKLADIAAIADIARARGALTLVDNTFASPYFQRPLELGADISLYSTTKYMGGHSDVVGGALALRMRAHEANALAVAGFLESHGAVERVIYPGLESHPQHDLARRQMCGFGGMIAVVLRGGEAAARDLVRRTKLFTLAESLGGVESLIELPAAMTHASVAGSALEVPAGLVRLSVGIEEQDDLIADLDRALG